ncbi:uncharacterized protein LOC125337643 [Corvus hawaiiensis]|uniref:uncharacterized protein LOC125337643 n=1 Tax=Corvus hawaiiensis TaxID=134902 RepID=UPI0020196764|nr:uncharacterized protein LOC125337643 [Corvus hawaiiensis]
MDSSWFAPRGCRGRCHPRCHPVPPQIQRSLTSLAALEFPGIPGRGGSWEGRRSLLPGAGQCEESSGTEEPLLDFRGYLGSWRALVAPTVTSTSLGPTGGSRHLPRVRRWPRSPFCCPGRDSKAPEGKQQIFCIFPICSQDVARAEAAPQRLRMSLVGLGGPSRRLWGREVLGTPSSCAGTQIPAGCPQRGSGGVPQLRELQQRGPGASRGTQGCCWPWGQAELGDGPGGTCRRVTGPCSQGNPDGATAGPIFPLEVCAVPWEQGLEAGMCQAQPGTGSVPQAFQDTAMPPWCPCSLDPPGHSAGSAWICPLFPGWEKAENPPNSTSLTASRGSGREREDGTRETVRKSP